jgi:hypothetical protein
MQSKTMRACASAPLFLLAAMLCAAVGAAGDPRGFDFDLNDDWPKWRAGFAEYSPIMKEHIAFVGRPSPLRSDLLPGRLAYYLSGNNDSDDLFLFMKRRIKGLTPNTRYALRLEITYSTNFIKDCTLNFLYLKGGITRREPRAIRKHRPYGDYVVMNVDKGGPTTGGRAAASFGLVELETPCPAESAALPWGLRTVSGDANFARSDERGRLWLLIGVDSVFEVVSHIFIVRVGGELTPQAAG